MHATQPPPTTDSPSATVSPITALRLAADYLTRHGWTQHGYYAPGNDTSSPPCCAIGAIALVCYGYAIGDPFDNGTDDIDDDIRPTDPAHLDAWHDFVTAHQALQIYLNRDRERITLPVDDWNDTPGLTANTVIATLRAAADYTATTAPFGQVPA